MASVTTIHQEFYKTPSSPIRLEHLPFASLTEKPISELVATLGWKKKLGVAATYGEKCCLNSLAFSTETQILLITLDDTSKSAKRQKKILKDSILCNDSLEKHGFFMERLAAALYLDLSLHIWNSFDIASDGEKRGSVAAYKGTLARAGDSGSLNEPIVKRIFAEQPFTLPKKKVFALRAWACYTAVQALPNMPGVINTSSKDPKARFDFLLRLAPYLTPWPIGAGMDVQMPTIRGSFGLFETNLHRERRQRRDRYLRWRCTSSVHQLQNPHPEIGSPGEICSSRLSPASSDLRVWSRREHPFGIQHIQFNTDQGEIKGRVKQVLGKAAKVVPHTQLTAAPKVTSVVTIGKEDLTGAESSRADLILNAFKGGDALLSSPFVRKIFFPGYNLQTLRWPNLPRTQPRIRFTYRQLNGSQQRAVEKCLSNEEKDRHVVVIVNPTPLLYYLSSP